MSRTPFFAPDARALPTASSRLGPAVHLASLAACAFGLAGVLTAALAPQPALAVTCVDSQGDPIGNNGGSIQNTACGLGANAEGNVASFNTAVGESANASGDGDIDSFIFTRNVAVGNQAQAQGDFSNNIAFGAFATATGVGSTNLAVGFGATASNNSIAFGTQATASHADSIAIGAGVTTTRVNQIAVGGESNTYTLAGIATQASRDAQTGPIYLVTSDGSGNLATSSFDIGGFQNQLAGLGDEIKAVGSLSAALAGLHPNARASGDNHLSGAIGTYNGDFGFAAGYFRNVGTNLLLSVGGATSGGSYAGNAGVTVSW